MSTPSHYEKAETKFNLLPYASNVGSPVIVVEDTDHFKRKQVTKFNNFVDKRFSELKSEMEKLVDEHTKEAKKNRVKITNLGWSQGDDFIVSKTTERKDGSDVLTSEISNGVVTHDWDSYKRGGKLKTNPAKFRDKVNAITKKLAGTKVPKKYKKDYGATYDKKEANTAAKRIAGAKLAEVRAKLAKKKK